MPASRRGRRRIGFRLRLGVSRRWLRQGGGERAAGVGQLLGEVDRAHGMYRRRDRAAESQQSEAGAGAHATQERRLLAARRSSTGGLLEGYLLARSPCGRRLEGRRALLDHVVVFGAAILEGELANRSCLGGRRRRLLHRVAQLDARRVGRRRDGGRRWCDLWRCGRRG